jgi:hypothetical protein
MSELRDKKLAVLIDADNVRPGIVEGLLAEIDKYGTANVKRIYGDWTLPNLGGWKATLLKYSIQPMQQFRYTVGKNATDGAMMIDAMDLLYTGSFDGFCIVSSDSDFTRLAARIRESGLTVYGFGEKKTPEAFVKACDKFVDTGLLGGAVAASKAKAKKPEIDKQLVELLRETVVATSDDTGWAGLGAVGQYISKRDPGFDSRAYGFQKLSDLVKAVESIQVKQQNKSLYVRLK